MQATFKMKGTPDQMELIRATGSKNKDKSYEAMEILGSFLGPVVLKVLNQAATSAMIYEDIPFDEDDSPSFPLDLYYDKDVGEIQVWQQTMSGGLPSSQIEGVSEVKIHTYGLDSAFHWAKKYARKSRLDVINGAINRIAQEILVQQEKNAWAVIMKAVAEASTNSTIHTITSGTQDVFQVNDMSRLMTLIRRLNTSFAGGTPVAIGARGLTDMIVSPEIKEQIRAFAYNPMNTRAGVLSGDATAGYTSSTVALPDGVRQRIYESAGASEIYGVTIIDILEFGVNQMYNQLFDGFSTGNVAHGGTTFDAADDEILLGLDLSRGAFKRPLEKEAETGLPLRLMVDDQWVARSDKAGFYTRIEEGRICIDNKAVVGIVV